MVYFVDHNVVDKIYIVHADFVKSVLLTDIHISRTGLKSVPG